jgi:hypothetical protein
MGRRRGGSFVFHGRWWAVRLPGNGKPDRFLRIGRRGDLWVRTVDAASVFALHGTARNILLRRIHDIPDLVLHHVGYLPTPSRNRPVDPWERPSLPAERNKEAIDAPE